MMVSNVRRAEVRRIIQEARDLIADESRWCQGAEARGSSDQVRQVAKLFDIEHMHNWQIVAFNIAPVSATSSLAKQWCALGAMHRVAGVDMSSPVKIDFCASGTALDDAKRLITERALAMYAPSYPDIGSGRFSPIAYVNDKLGHEATIAVFDKVLADETIA